MVQKLVLRLVECIMIVWIAIPVLSATAVYHNLAILKKTPRALICINISILKFVNHSKRCAVGPIA